MPAAARAIIVNNDQLLVMYRNKNSSEYYTLIGGGVDDGENIEEALAREVMEETGLKVISSKLVFIEKHQPPYREQYIFTCELDPYDSVAIQPNSEETMLNRLGMDLYELRWVTINNFPHIAFRTPQLQAAIVDALDNGFPDKAINV